MTSKRSNLPQKVIKKQPEKPQELINDLRGIIEKTRQSMASTVNAGLALLYWHVGNRIRSEILRKNRADYGRSIVMLLSQQLALVHCQVNSSI